jgi:predicted Zn-dependent protease
MTTRKTLVACWLLVIGAGCATNPVTGRREFSLMSEAQEIALGEQSDVEVRREMGVYDDRSLQEYVSSIGRQLADRSERPNLPWHFTVVDVPAVNAFALPGGYIYITRGILAFLGDEAELAGVLGHEIGHVTARHAARQYSRSTGTQLGLLLGGIFVPEARPFGQLAASALGVLFLKYGRDDELQADDLGVRYAASSGWDPNGVPAMLTTLGRIEEASDNKGVPNWLSTHPAAENRVQQVQAAVLRAKPAGSSVRPTARADFLRRVDGLVYGDNPEQGIVRGSRFLHPRLRFAVDFPDKWDVTNGQTQVVARQPNSNVFIMLQIVTRRAGQTLDNLAVRSMETSGFRAIAGTATTINGLPAFLGTYRGAIEGVGQVGVRAAHIEHDREVYLVAGVAPAAAYDGVEPRLTSSVQSFRPLSREEAEGIRPNRLDLYTVREGDTWTSMAERLGQGLVKASTLAIMNGRQGSDPPRAGEQVKVVVPG